MHIGIPKEIKDSELRVALAPHDVFQLTNRGHEVVVERGAGDGAGYNDNDYLSNGARLGTQQEVWQQDIIIKVKEPQHSEYHFLLGGQTLFSYLHLAANKPLTHALVDYGVTAIGFETFTEDNDTPMLDPMSEVAGEMAALVGANYLLASNGGKGKLMSDATVVVIGCGTAGRAAGTIARGMGATVVYLELEGLPLEQATTFAANANPSDGSGLHFAVASTPQNIAKFVAEADIVIGCVHVPGEPTQRLVTAEMVKSMEVGSVIVDVAIDQGGCFETSRPTTHSNPTYTEHGVIHYCVANMPGAVARTASERLSQNIIEYALILADEGVHNACRVEPNFKSGINVMDGRIVHPALQRVFKTG